MTRDFNKPVVTDNYADILPNLVNLISALVQSMDTAYITDATNIPNHAKRWNSSTNKWEKLTSGSWSDMASTYAINVATADLATTASAVAWSGITSKPTTVSGFGITDMSSQSVASADSATSASQVVTSAFSFKEVGGLLSIFNSTNQRVTFDSIGSPTFLADTVRFKANFSDSTQSKIASFQTKTTNGATNLQVLPDGTGVSSSFTFLNAADVDNAGQLKTFINATRAGLNTFKTGTGTVLPLVLQVAGTDKFTLSADGATATLATTNISDGTRTVTVANLLSGTINRATSAPSNLASTAAIGTSLKWATEDHVHQIPAGIPKAFVRFNGANGTIRSQSNVSSITVVGGGTCRINFTNAMANTNYTAIATGGWGFVSSENGSYIVAVNYQTTSVDVNIVISGFGNNNTEVSVVIY